ncbi:Glycosyltransferase involved in cell wall bisynthesis [Actinopolyspora xinjiangensis]|uniref:Glycosyltransferase involved in cell wall bisynthesis n=1 Tax=Actinopolyspora xinjiangensis TaxID=405564 RepID=A0A1H0N9P7_9ACTN|nr:Glycosyltransferase involved in cell wall bisynthesis [Actinopolyspora xinjiangensis]
MRVVLDGTPLLGPRTGIGRYTARLCEALAELPGTRVRLLGLTTRGWRALRAAAPEGTRACGPPLPARVLRACWSRSEFPPVELLGGGCDVVHGTNFVRPPARRAAGVVTVHDLDFLDSSTTRGRARRAPEPVARSVRRASVVCTPTAAVAERVVARFGISERRVVVTPLGVDREWFEARPPDESLRRRYGLPEEYLLFVGDDGPRKGLPNLREALDDTLPPLVRVGPSSTGTENAPPGERERHIGYLPDHELRSVVAGAAALVLPSRDEGFGLPVLEAMAAGVPVVCGDVAALREVSGGHARLVPYGRASALRTALHRAVESAADHGSREAARRHAAGFTWRECAAATMRAYRMAHS